MIKIAIVEDEIEMSSDLKKHVEMFFNQHDKKITIDIFDNAVKFLDKYKQWLSVSISFYGHQFTLYGWN